MSTPKTFAVAGRRLRRAVCLAWGRLCQVVGACLRSLIDNRPKVKKGRAFVSFVRPIMLVDEIQPIRGDVCCRATLGCGHKIVFSGVGPVDLFANMKRHHCFECETKARGIQTAGEFRVVIPACKFDTDGDGNCPHCVSRGGCPGAMRLLNRR